MANFGDYQNKTIPSLLAFECKDEIKKELVGLDHLITENILHIFTFLPVKDLIHVGSTCHRLKLISEDPSIWSIFYKRISLSQNKMPTKLVVVGEIKSLIEGTQENGSEAALQAHITLSRLELSSLEKAFECAKSIRITEKEKSARPPYHCASFYDKCYSLAIEFLSNNDLSKAEEIMNGMVPSTFRSIIALYILKIYLKKGDFEKALSAMRCVLNNNHESSIALSLFIWNTKQANDLDFTLRALREFSSFKVCLSCVKDFNEFLIENGELEKSAKLQVIYPKAFDKEALFTDVLYYAHNNQIERSIQSALLLSDLYTRIRALGEIAKIMDGNYSMLNGIEGLEEANIAESFKKRIENLQKELWDLLEKTS